MSEPTAALQAVRASTAGLLAALDDSGWSDTDLARSSLLPGWTRGHVLTHLARNADGIAATLAGALRGEFVPRYPGGRDQRNGEIDAGAGRPFADIRADVAESAERLDRVFGAVREASRWDAETDGRLAGEWPDRRLVELELHRVDLDGGYVPAQWPTVLVADLLPKLVDTVAARASFPLRITVASGVVPELDGRSWTIGAGDPFRVEAPDWALLAWLAGRPEAVEDTLTDPPTLVAWD